MATSPKKRSARTLIIAEKPSVARDIIKCLNDSFKETKTHFEGKEYVVSYAVGHLLTIAEPAEIDERFKSWSLKNLPIIPNHYDLKPIRGSKMQLNALKKLVEKPDITTIVNACDAGREGELIFQYIIDYIKAQEEKTDVPSINEKTIKRLWLQSMTERSIKEAFQKLRSHSEMKPLADAAKSRSEADWLVGINGSRGLTSFKSKGGGFFVTPCGRVQTPTLSMIIRREKEIEAFTPLPYHTLIGTFLNGKDTYEGKWFDPQFKKSEQFPHGRAERLFKTEDADRVIEKCTQQAGSIAENAREASENCPLLYDLTTLQREANSRFSYSAKRTLSIIQSLYERHKMLTYPRTNSRYLPEDYLDGVKKVFTNLSQASLPQGTEKHALTALENDYVKSSKRVFDDKKVSDHHAIIPTEKVNFSALSTDEQKIYMAVVERFIGIFFPAAKSLKTTRITTVSENTFKTEGKILVSPGWKVVAGRLEEDKVLKPLEKNPEGLFSATCEKVLREDLETKPPSRYSEATLLSAMENAGKTIEDETLREAMEESGIGTPATRASIIEKLIADKYMIKQARELIPTSKAFDLFVLIETLKLEQLTSPKLTGEWEHKLSLIEQSQLSREDFMKQITEDTSKLVASIKDYDEEGERTEASFSPINGEKVYKHLTYFKSAEGTFTIRAIIGGRRMQDTEIATLIQERKVGPFNDFRSRRGIPFAATIVLDEKNKVKLSFLNEDEDITVEDLQTLDCMGTSYLDNSSVYKTPHAYLTESYILKKPTGFRINRFILGKELDEASIKKMIVGEKSDLIQGFRSARTQRLFDAFLQINESAKIQFSFPPRKSKKNQTAEEPSPQAEPKQTAETPST